MLQLSHTQIDTWRQCHYHWFLRYVLRVPGAPSDALAYGSAFHSAAEFAGQEKIAGRVSSSQAIIDVAQAELDTAIAADATGFLRGKRTIMQRNLTITLPVFAQEILPHIHPIAVEDSFALRIEQARFTQANETITVTRALPYQRDGRDDSSSQWAEETMRRMLAIAESQTIARDSAWTGATQIRFTGKIDVMTDTSTILDYKTGKPWEQDAEHSKDQAAAYMLARPESRRVTFIVFPIENAICQPQLRPTTRTTGQLVAYRHQMLAIAEEMEAAQQTGTIATNPGYLCGWCDTLGSCSAGQHWLRAHHRKAVVPVLAG